MNTMWHVAQTSGNGARASEQARPVDHDAGGGPSPLDDLADRPPSSSSSAAAAGDPVSVVFLTRFAGESSSEAEFLGEVTVFATDGTRAWSGIGLKEPESGHRFWPKTVEAALGGRPRGPKTPTDIKLEARVITDTGALQVSWNWKVKARLPGGALSTIGVNCELGEPLRPVKDPQVVVLAMFDELFRSHQAASTASGRELALRKEFESYLSAEEERTKTLLVKCTALLNEKKERIRQLERAGRGGDREGDRDDLNLFLDGESSGAGAPRIKRARKT